MEIFSFEKLKYYMDKVDIKVIINNTLYSFSPEYKICVDFNAIPPKSETEFIGIHVNEKLYKTVDCVLEDLNITRDIELIEINSYKNLKDFEDDRFIQSCTMEELLKFYDDCNVFSLTIAEYFGVNSSIEEKEKAYANYVMKSIDSLKELYEKYKKSSLPSFDELYDEIKRECLENGKKHKNDEYFYYSFIADLVMKKETKYAEPTDFYWTFYHQVGMLIDKKKEALQDIDKNYFNAQEFLSFNKVLKDNYIRHEFTYSSLVTEGPLQAVLYFKLNDETKKFLLNQYIDSNYDNKHLEDLALYINDKPRYASCSHEGFCYNIKND